MKRLVLRGGVAGVCALMLGALPGRAAVVPQPADKHSFLIQNDHKGIRDDDFANIIKSALLKDGASNVLDAKFIFQTCFGGGMLDDLQTALGDKVKWVGGAASRWDEPSIGQVSTAENDARPGKGLAKYDAKWVANPPQDWWTKELLPELPKDQTLLQGIDNATANDKVGPNGKAPYGAFEHGQSVAPNGGDTIKLKDPAAKSYHAVLWAGSPDAMRHYNDIENMRNALMTAWGVPDIGPGNVTIDVLFGDGAKKPDGTDLPASWKAQAATRERLEFIMSNLPLDPNEQFLFYASDHGGNSTTIQAKPPEAPRKPVPPGTNDLEPFSLAHGELLAMLTDDSNVPLLTVDYDGLLPDVLASVVLNGVFLGYLSPLGSTMEFAVPESALALENIVEIGNHGLASFEIVGKTFFTGAISTNPVPEPGAGAVLAVMASVVWLRRRR